MKKEKSCGAIIINDKDEILLIKHNVGHWAFPKGHIENNETDELCALREIKEETNLDVNIITNIKEKTTYSPKEGVLKDVIYFVALPINNDIKLQQEEVNDYLWLPLKDALNKLTYDNDKKILESIYNQYKSSNTTMNLGIEEARKTMNQNIGGPFGAVIVKDNKIIAVASNTVLGSHDPTAHAEVNAIRKAGKVLGTHDLSDCILYATGYPCPMCLSAIIWANIKEVYYGTDLKEAEDIGFRDDFIYNYILGKNKDVLSLKQLNHDECLELFKEYSKKNKEL